MWKAALFALLPLAAQAEGRADALAALLAQAPLSVASPGGAGEAVHFSDYTAAAPLVTALAAELMPGRDGPVGWHIRAASPVVGETVAINGGADWPALVGYSLADLRHSLVAGRPPEVLTLLTLDPAVVPGIGPALEGNGYTPDDRLPVPAWWRGEEDFAVDFSRHNPADPFGGQLGQSSRVALREGVLFQSAGWPALASALGDAPVMGDLPGVQALLAALDDPALGPGALIRAKVFATSETLAVPGRPVTLDMTAEELAAVLGTPPDQAEQALAAIMATGPSLIADIATPEAAVAALALTFDTRADAVAVAAHITRAWEGTPSLVTGESYAALGLARVTVTGKGPFVTLLVVPGSTGADLRNRGFDALVQAWLMRDLVFLPRL